MARPATPADPLADELADGALSIEAAAEFCSLSRDVIEQARDRGELVAFYYGRKPLFPKRAVVRWLAGLAAKDLTGAAGAGAQQVGGVSIPTSPPRRLRV